MNFDQLLYRLDLRVMWIEIIYRIERKKGASRLGAAKQTILRR